MNSLLRFKFFLWHFSQFKVAMIGYVRPRLITLNEQTIVIRIPLKRRTKNHLNSMYFGALAVGADLAGGFHGLYHADLADCKVSLAFKSFQAQFLRRPEQDVYFVCEAGGLVKAMIEETQKTGERINKPIPIIAYTNYPEKPEAVAHFTLELSLKALSHQTKQ
ncbi:DUF4442 domain-containing protein [Legionella sp. km772]|uniref:DUF4442 domain-containing protein n=1 Tax=Legionella sp. km772 TaxID=2498111 RepID=UPI000F8C9DCF|nr:DUF4442 domain-containing protein [Legionella sp. km772]RUR09232.1 DUF4442 domain-containing protein [Legionella sp. km772]